MPTVEELDWWHEYNKVLLQQIIMMREQARHDPQFAAWVYHAAMYPPINFDLKKDNLVIYPDVVTRQSSTTCLSAKLSRYVCPQRRRWWSSQGPKPRLQESRGQ